MEKSLVHILIVEDVEPVARSLGAVLQGAGYGGIHYVASAEELFEFLALGGEEGEKKDVDLVLMDISLPGTDGIKACRLLKADPFYRDLPVVMVTAQESSEVLYEAFEAGALDYLVKPPKPLELQARVGAVLRLKHEMDRRKLWEKKLLEVTVQLNEAKQTLARLSRPELPCLSDSRSFNELLRREWEQATLKESPISLLMINVDCSQRFGANRQDGRAEECLTRVGEALCQVMKRKRPGDFVTRNGFDDFAVVLPTTDGTGALKVAERIQSHLDAIQPEGEGEEDMGRLVVSIGVSSTMPTPMVSSRVLIAAADEALYLAKKEGGNCIRLASD